MPNSYLITKFKKKWNTSCLWLISNRFPGGHTSAYENVNWLPIDLHPRPSTCENVTVTRWKNWYGSKAALIGWQFLDVGVYRQKRHLPIGRNVWHSQKKKKKKVWPFRMEHGTKENINSATTESMLSLCSECVCSRGHWQWPRSSPWRHETAKERKSSSRDDYVPFP